MSKPFEWLRLRTNILDNAKVKIIRRYPDGDKIFVLWIGMLCLAMKHIDTNGMLYVAEDIPYSIDDLSNEFGIDKRTIELGLGLFAKYKMINVLVDKTIEIKNFSKYQYLNSQLKEREAARKRMLEFREKSKCYGVTSSTVLTRLPFSDTDTDTDTEKKENTISKEIEKKTVADAPHTTKNIFKAPSEDEIIEYGQMYFRDEFTIEEGLAFFDHFRSNGWKVGGKAPMKDWKCALNNWHRRDMSFRKGGKK